MNENQTTIFDLLYPKYKITKKIRMITFFSGYDSQCLAMKYLGVNYEHYKTCEWAVKSIQALKDIHFEEDIKDYSKDIEIGQIKEFLFNKGISSNYNEPMSMAQINRLNDKQVRTIYNNIQATHNLVNIQQVKGSDLEISDTDKYEYILTYSFPCGLAGTKIITKNGYKNIENIKSSDYVLTHKNRFCKVNKIMTRKSNHYYKLKGLGVPKLYLTEEHPLFVLRDNKEQWVKVKELKLTDKFLFNINQNNFDCSYSNELLWLLGRYVADGHINKYTYNSINFSIGFEKEEVFLKNIPIEYKNKFKKFKKTCWDYRIADQELKKLCEQFKTGAKNKTIPQWVIDLPKDKLQFFFNGYISGDGYIRERSGNTQIMFSTVSEELFLGLQQIIAKLYGVICSCYIRKDNRKKTFNDCYDGQFTISNNKKINQFVINDKIATKIRKIERIEQEIDVYNFEVDKDNSYTCNNVIVHNCQDLSLAGKGKGMSDTSTRSGMLWEVERILSECKELDSLPQILLMENVPQVHGVDNVEDFNKWQLRLEELGYKNYWQDLIATDYGIPQTRNRCFMVSILGDYNYTFPKKQELKLKLKDMLEDNVDEKYYLSDKQIKDVQNWNAYEKPLENMEKTNKSNISPTLTTRSGAYAAGMVLVKDTENYIEWEDGKNIQMNCRAWKDKVGTLNTGGETKILIKNATKKGYLEAEDGDGVDISSRMEYHRGTVQKGKTQTLTTMGGENNGVVSKDLKIRKLTPRECFRLMGVKDEDFEKCAKNQSDSSLYHLAGDSIVVNVLMAIFKELL